MKRHEPDIGERIRLANGKHTTVASFELYQPFAKQGLFLLDVEVGKTRMAVNARWDGECWQEISDESEKGKSACASDPGGEGSSPSSSTTLAAKVEPPAPRRKLKEVRMPAPGQSQVKAAPTVAVTDRPPAPPREKKGMAAVIHADMLRAKPRQKRRFLITPDVAISDLVITRVEQRPTCNADPVVRHCRVCKCTDDDCSGCIERTGRPCHWVGADLCSACQTFPGITHSSARKMARGFIVEE